MLQKIEVPVLELMVSFLNLCVDSLFFPQDSQIVFFSLYFYSLGLRRPVLSGSSSSGCRVVKIIISIQTNKNGGAVMLLDRVS